MISPPFCMIFGVSIKNSNLAKLSSAVSQANNILTSIERVEEMTNPRVLIENGKRRISWKNFWAPN